MSFKLTTVKNTRDIRAVKRNGAVATTAGSLLAVPVAGGAIALAGVATVGPQLKYLANETTASSTATFSGTLIAPGDEFIVDTTGNTAVADNGKRMVIDATGLLLTNGAIDAAAGPFIQVDVVGATTDRKIVARHV